MNLAEKFLDCLTKTKDAKKAIASVIYEKLKTDSSIFPTLTEIEMQNDIVFVPFIISVVDDDTELKKAYDEIVNIDSPIERFSIALTTYWDGLNKGLTDRLKPVLAPWEQLYKNINQPWLYQYQDTTKALQFERLQPAFEHIEKIQRSLDFSQLRQIQQTVAFIQPEWIATVQRINEIISPLITPLQSILGQYSSTMAEIAAGISFPNFSEGRKQELIESHRKWGQLGWTLLPNAPINFFSKCPDNSVEADKRALIYCKANHLDELFSKLRTAKIKKSDLDEAVYCFSKKQYKACALLLFGIMDAILIRKQPKSNRRSVGASALRKLKAKFKAHRDLDQTFFLLMDYVNLTVCLEAFFSDGNDFKKEPNIINRNYIGHGMNVRKVRKKDCIQLFLALYNLVGFMEY